MKNLILSAIAVFVISSIYGQAPQLINYQGVARDNSGNELVTQAIGLRISLREAGPTGTIVYQETHAPTTNQFGLFNIQIGGGSVVQGDITSISWGLNTHYIEVEMDETGGSNYQQMGITQLVSVPYALYAENGPPGPQGQQGPEGFDPHFPDGTTNLTSVFLNLYGNIDYTVPAGKHFVINYTQTYGMFEFFLNGKILWHWGGVSADSPWMVDEGDVISCPGCTANQPRSVAGYLAPRLVDVVNTDLHNNPYTVPNGKTLFVLSAHSSQSGFHVNFDGVWIIQDYVNNNKLSGPIVATEGTVISASQENGKPVLLNGYLKDN